MARKTRKQKERATQRREYLTRLVGEKTPTEAIGPEVKEEISKKEIPEEAKTRLEQKSAREEVKIGPPMEHITSDFKKALVLSGLFIAILVILAILEAKYGFLGPLASRLMEKLVR